MNQSELEMRHYVFIARPFNGKEHQSRQLWFDINYTEESDSKRKGKSKQEEVI